jgi:hypothetical protein
MLAADLASPGARDALLGAAALAVDRSTAYGGEKVPASLLHQPDAAPTRVRYAPPAALQVPRGVVAGLLGRAQFDPLRHPSLSEREVDRLAAVYAPSFDVQIGGDHDRFGRLRWRRADAPEVDAARPTVYVQAAYARYGEHVLLQLAYTIWFGGRVDAVAWRVTLAPDGEPLVYDAIGLCGSFHLFFPTPRARPRTSPEAPRAAEFLPRVGEGERPVVTIASGTHHVRRVGLAQGPDSLVRYSLRLRDELRSLPRAAGRHAGIFGADGRIAGTTCVQRFDDAELLERRFELDL